MINDIQSDGRRPPHGPRLGAIPRRAVVMYGMSSLSFVRSLHRADGFTLLTEEQGIPMASMASRELAQATIDGLVRDGLMNRWVDVDWLDDAPEWFTASNSSADRLETTWLMTMPETRQVGRVVPHATYCRRRVRRPTGRLG